VVHRGRCLASVQSKLHFHPQELAVETEIPPHHSVDDRAGEVTRWLTAEPVHSLVEAAVDRIEESKEQAKAEERTVVMLSQSVSGRTFAGSNSDTDNAAGLLPLAHRSCKSDTTCKSLKRLKVSVADLYTLNIYILPLTRKLYSRPLW